MICFEPLRKMLLKRKINKSELAKLAGISNTVIHRISTGQNINLSCIEKICKALQCSPKDIIEFIQAPKKELQKDKTSISHNKNKLVIINSDVLKDLMCKANYTPLLLSANSSVSSRIISNMLNEKPVRLKKVLQISSTLNCEANSIIKTEVLN